MENLQVEEERPNTSLNKKRGIKNIDASTNSQQGSLQYSQFLKEKPQTQQGSRKDIFQQSDQRISSSSQSQFRAVKMHGSTTTQLHKDLGFIPPVNRNQEFSKTLSSGGGGSSFPMMRDFSKTIPKNIFYDKERLYEELLESKGNNNALLLENQALRTKFVGQQEEMTRLFRKDQLQKAGNNPFGQESLKLSKIFKDINQKDAQQVQQNTPTIILSLKQQVNKLKEELSQKDKLISENIRAVKHTSIRELETQIKMYSEECLRLRRMLEQTLKNDKDERFAIVGVPSNEEDQKQRLNESLNQAFTLMKQDNIQMAANLKKIEEENFAQRVVIETLEKQLRSQRQDGQQLKRIIFEKDREIESLKGNDPFAQNGKKNPQFTVEGQLKLEVEKKQQELNQLTHSMQQKDKRIMDVEKKAREKEADYVDKLTLEIKEKQEIQNALDKERDNVFKLRQDLERVQIDRRYTKTDLTQVSQIQINQQIESEENPQKTSVRNPTIIRPSGGSTPSSSIRGSEQAAAAALNLLQKRRLPKITMDEVKPIAEDLKYRLKLQKVSLQQFEKNLFGDESSRPQGTITLSELYSSLGKPPSRMTDQESILSLARYLIEDNNQESVQFDINATNKVSFVKSAVRHLLDSYVILSDKQELLDLIKITAALNKSKGAIVDLLSRDPASKRIQGIQCCDKKQLIYAFEQLEVQLTTYDLEIVFEKLFEKCQNLSGIPIESIFKIFSSDVYNEETKTVGEQPKDVNFTNHSGDQQRKQLQQQESQKQDSRTNISSSFGEGNQFRPGGNQSKAFKNVTTDFNVFNSNVDQEAVESNKNPYQFDNGEEEVVSQGEVSDEENSQK